MHPTDIASAQMSVVSQDPESWDILYSAGAADHPTAPPTAWAISLPNAGGHLNYVKTPYRTTVRPQQIVLTFRIEESPGAIPVSSEADASPCRDRNPCTPVAEFHVFFEQQGDDLTSESGRWWYTSGFRLTNVPDDSYDAQPFMADGQPHTIDIPLSAEVWTSVTGRGTAADFEAALKNIGYVGITFGGSDFFGHGVDVEQGTVQFQLINYTVE
jgi:uncharacterized protein YndB with AHSA1/START domain